VDLKRRRRGIDFCYNLVDWKKRIGESVEKRIGKSG